MRTFFLQFAFADTPPNDSSLQKEFILEIQQALMENVFANQTPEFLNEISHQQPNSPFCQGWEGVKCENEVVRELSFSYRALPNLNIEYLPRALRFLRIVSCKQNFYLNTRRLPADLEVIGLMANYIHGTLDMHGLPSNLRRLNLSNNKITGPLQIYPLPPHLTHLNLCANRIRQHTVYYHDLPKCFKAIRLKGGGNSISKFEPLFPEERIGSKRMFNERTRHYRRRYSQ